MESMSSDDDRSLNLTSWIRELLMISKRAWDQAAARDFAGLALSIDERERHIKEFSKFGDLSSMPQKTQEQIGEVMEKAKKFDREIQKVLMHEMEQDGRAIRDTANKAKALSAYDRTVLKHRRFDTQR